MRMDLKHARDQEGTLGRCHLSDMKRIDHVEVKLDRLRRLAVRQLEDTQRGTPSNRITMTEMSGQALDRRGDELLERSPLGVPRYFSGSRGCPSSASTTARRRCGTSPAPLTSRRKVFRESTVAPLCEGCSTPVSGNASGVQTPAASKPRGEPRSPLVSGCKLCCSILG